MSDTILNGVFIDNLWRNEKTGQSFFRFKTNSNLFLKKMYQSSTVERNSVTHEDETWYTVICDSSETGIPFKKKGDPIMVIGYFDSDNSDELSYWNFKVHSVKETTIDDNITIKYLSSEDFGIPESEAVKIVRTYGNNIYEFCKRNDAVHKIAEVTELDENSISMVVKKILETVEERKVFAHLSKANIPYPYCAKAIRILGENALQKIKARPYKYGKLLNLDFMQCDSIAKIENFNPFSKGRIQSAATEAIKEYESSGNIYCKLSDFKQSVFRLLQNNCVFNIPLTSIITTLKDDFGFERINGENSVYRKALIAAEKRVAKNIKRLAIETVEPYNKKLINYAEMACNMSYGEQQKDAFPSVLGTRGVKIVTGGPGTGKTTTIKGLLLAYQKMHPADIIKLCAPTGRAAQRLSESTGIEATTIHRLIDYRPHGNCVTHKDLKNPIDADLIIVDEMSMVPIELFDLLLEAIKTGTTLVLVGDIHQLESVGPGAVLHDLLLSNERLIQKTLLTDVFRQKGNSPIIDNSILINKGEVGLVTNDDFQIIKTKCPEESLEVIKNLYHSLYNPENPFETQLICPARSGLTGINNLNDELQDLINSKGKTFMYGKQKFRVDDKIIMTRNNYFFQYYNGDIGVIKEIGDSSITLEIRGDSFVLTRDMYDDIELCYAMTIHKSQGSEFSTIIMSMAMEPAGMLIRSIFYTGVTRAKTKVYIINEGSAMETAIKTDKSQCRNTLLSSYLPIPTE